MSFWPLKRFPPWRRKSPTRRRKGFKVIAATGAGNEILVLMESLPEGESKREYRVMSTSKTSTFEKEINEAARRVIG